MSVIHFRGSDTKLSFYKCGLLGQICCESGVCVVSVENYDYSALAIVCGYLTMYYVILVGESFIILNELM